MSLKISTSKIDQWTLVFIDGRVDAFNDKKTIQVFEDLRISSECKIAVDLSKADFISLAFLRWLLSFSTALRTVQGDLVLLNPAHSIRRQIEIFIGLSSFKVFETLEDLNMGLYLPRRSEFESTQSAF